MSILIDPYMFELSEEQEIKDNIDFFIKIISISTNSDKDNRYKIALYPGMIERLKAFPYQPFPIKILDNYDSDMKSIIIQLNQSFRNVLLKSIESIDIDCCDGDQNFLVDGECVNDEKYYDLFITSLIPCYSKNCILDERILTGKKSKGKHIGDNGELYCKCELHQYSRKYRFVGVDAIIDKKKLIFEELKKKSSEIKEIDRVEASMGDHHNHIRADGKKFKTLDELSTRTKSVLSLLKRFGLFKIIFGKFVSDGVREIGSFRIHSIEEKDTQDILLVKFSTETNMLVDTYLYFPKGIGTLLKDIFQDEQLTYKNVSELIEKM